MCCTDSGYKYQLVRPRVGLIRLPASAFDTFVKFISFAYTRTMRVSFDGMHAFKRLNLS